MSFKLDEYDSDIKKILKCTIFATYIKKLCLLQSGITYDMIECSQFIWFSIKAFDKNAANAILDSMPNVFKFCKQYNINLPTYRGYPHAIHFAILSDFAETWHPSMYKYFKIVPINKITPGCIISWRFNNYGIDTQQSDTGHTGCVTSYISEDNRFYFSHSIPANKDPKNIGGPTQTIFSVKGNILKSIIDEKMIGGALCFIGLAPCTDIVSFSPPSKISFNNVKNGRTLLTYINDAKI